MEQSADTGTPVVSAVENKQKKRKWPKNCYGNRVRRGGLRHRVWYLWHDAEYTKG